MQSSSIYVLGIKQRNQNSRKIGYIILDSLLDSLSINWNYSPYRDCEDLYKYPNLGIDRACQSMN